MLKRLLIVAIAMYLLADFCDAGMPGAFNFSADNSVEVVRVEKPQAPTNPLRDLSPVPRASHVQLRERIQMVHVKLLVVSATTRASDRPSTPLRPRSAQLSSEDSPAASPAV